MNGLALYACVVYALWLNVAFLNGAMTLMQNHDLPLVSVVIPTFNRPDFLFKSIQSVCTQTYDNIEILVVDDNSSISYDSVVPSLPEGVRFIKRDINGGGSAARNTGIDHAQGEYVAFLDDDDVWLPSKIEEQMSAIGDALACHCGVRFDGSGIAQIENKTLISLDDLCKRNALAGTSGLLVRRDIVARERFDEALPRMQDWDLYLRLASHGSIAYVRKVLYVYGDGRHTRITNLRSVESQGELQKQRLMLDKHKDLLGLMNYRIRLGELILQGFLSRNDKLVALKRTYKEIGLFATVRCLMRMGYKTIKWKKTP